MSTLHRFYTGETKDRSGELVLLQEFWINDAPLVVQVLRVLRMRVGDEFVLFDGRTKEVLYRIIEVEPHAIKVQKITDLMPKCPSKHITLAWSLLKKDKNDWVLQKATELGVGHFVPLICDRTEMTSFDESRAHKIIIEASEQCGRHSIPSIQEPVALRNFIGQRIDSTQLYIADMGGKLREPMQITEAIVVVGPEGGWSGAERELFREKEIPIIGLGEFTLRAETACLMAVAAI